MFWRWALQGLLQHAVREAATRAVDGSADAEEQDAQQSLASEQPAAQDRCDIGLIFALGIEAGGLLEKLTDRVDYQGSGFRTHRGRITGRTVAIVISGVGQAAAARAAEALIAGHSPQFVISAGFAGGLQPHIQKYDLLLADAIVNEQKDQLSIQIKLPPDATTQGSKLHAGRLLTTDRIIRSRPEKLQLGQTHRALAVDMESFAVARTCSNERQRMIVVRVISDTADEELPHDVERLLKQRSTAGRLGAALRVVAGRPSSIKELWGLKEQALIASDRLASFLEGMIGQLAPITIATDRAQGALGSEQPTREDTAL